MSISTNKKFWLSGILSILLFSSLMVHRLELGQWTDKVPGNANDLIREGLKASEHWMAVYQNDRKIGFSHHILSPIQDGYSMSDKTVMRIQTMGVVQDIAYTTRSTTHTDLSLKEFEVTLSSGVFDFSVQGHIRDGILTLTSRDQSMEPSPPQVIKLENRPYLSTGLLRAAQAANLKSGEQVILFVFDPTTLGQAPVNIQALKEETIQVMGKKERVRKFSLYFKGVRQYAWINAQGEVLKETGMLGMSLIRTTREDALKEIPGAGGEDFTRLAAVPVNRKIVSPGTLSRMTVRVKGLDEAAKEGLHGGRQSMDGELLTIQKDSLAGLPSVLASKKLSAIDPAFRQADPFIQSEHPRIRQLAQTFKTSGESPLKIVNKIVAWLRKNIKREPVLSIPNALSTLKGRKGDCNEHAMLMAALCRAVDIPARVDTGLVYLNGSFYYHAWNRVYLGRWVSVDALFGQVPADVTHIRLIPEKGGTPLDLLGMMGRLNLEIVKP